MQKMFQKLSFLILSGICVMQIQAQQSIPVSGGTAIGYGGSVSYTVGQMVYTTNTEKYGSVVHGIQQPYEITEESISDLSFGISLQCSVYPNPVENILTLFVKYYIDEDITCRLYDSNSQLLLTQQVDRKENLIIMTYLPPSTYYLIVEQKKQKTAPRIFKSFKIIKK